MNKGSEYTQAVAYQEEIKIQRLCDTYISVVHVIKHILFSIISINGLK